jgi:hypothetical protein
MAVRAGTKVRSNDRVQSTPCTVHGTILATRCFSAHNQTGQAALCPCIAMEVTLIVSQVMSVPAVAIQWRLENADIVSRSFPPESSHATACLITKGTC